MLKINKSTIVQVCLLAALVLPALNASPATRFGMGRSIGRPPMSGPQHHNAEGGGVPIAPNSPIRPVGNNSVNGQNAPITPNTPKAPINSQISPGAGGGAPTLLHQNAVPPQAQQANVQRSFMGNLLGGVAAGLGVSWLMHSMGWGQQSWDGGGMDEFIGAALIVLVVIIVVLFLLRRFNNNKTSGRQNKTVGGPYSGRFDGMGSPTNPVEFQNYKAKNVGNDASARPWEGNASDSSGAYPNDSMPHYSSVPAGFDVRGFVNTAKEVFMTLQAAWDRSDMATLHAMLTDYMLGEIKSQLNEREQHATGIVNQTDVVTLHAELLGIQETSVEYLASVEFSGLIREDPTQGPTPFREVWSLCRPKDGSTGWLVSGVQALQ